MKKIKLIFPLIVLIFSLFLSSCASPVSYVVDKEHEGKMKVIYNMIEGLLENDSEKYLSTIEQGYIENVTKVVDTLGRQYYDADNFDDFISSFFSQNKAVLEANYGEDIKVELSFNSVKEGTTDGMGLLLDDYSVSYKIPTDDIQAVYEVSVKIKISASVYSGEKNSNFTLFQMKSGNYCLHPNSFLYTF